jgi:hypothetical protein
MKYKHLIVVDDERWSETNDVTVSGLSKQT